MSPRDPFLPARDEGVEIQDYLAVVRRQIVTIVFVSLVVLGLALAYSISRTPTFTARAEVLVQPPATSEGLRLDQAISLDTEARLVTSAPIAELAKESLGSPLTITQLLQHVRVETAPDTFVLDVLFSDPKPGVAAEGANAFADAYLKYKRELALEEIAQQRAVIEDQISELRGLEREQNLIVQESDPGSTEYLAAQDQLNRIDVQMALLTSQLTTVAAVVDPGTVILPATPPSSPSSPKHLVNAAVGLFLGLFLGIIVAFLRDRADDRIHDRRDLALYLPLPVLAYVPDGRTQQSARLVVEDEPRGPSAESYRTARTAVLAMAARRDMTVLAIVSPMQGEGKSTTSANLAAALSQADKNVLVVSADLRKPRVHEFYGVTNQVGLSEVLAGDVDITDAITKSRLPSVWVLPGGQAPAHPAELLQSPRLAAGLEQLRGLFDFVILDCPPILGLSDCLAIVPFADAVVMVVQAERSRGGAIVEACDQLERIGARFQGAIVNGVHLPRGWRREYGYYSASPDHLDFEKRPAADAEPPGSNGRARGTRPQRTVEDGDLERKGASGEDG
jgi:capsular exopolysaccharide synthesis family protein